VDVDVEGRPGVDGGVRRQLAHHQQQPVEELLVGSVSKLLLHEPARRPRAVQIWLEVLGGHQTLLPRQLRFDPTDRSALCSRRRRGRQREA
jgi:hypothetical protein